MSWLIWRAAGACRAWPRWRSASMRTSTLSISIASWRSGKPAKPRKAASLADDAGLPVDLSGLRGLDLDAEIRFGSLGPAG